MTIQALFPNTKPNNPLALASGIALALASLVTPSLAHAQDKHVHDEGLVQVIQEGKEWHFQFTIPAVNAFGFEHLPETADQKQEVKSFIQHLNSSDNVVKLDGNCALVSMHESATQAFLMASHEDDHDDDHHEEDDHHDEQHDEKGHEKDDHHDEDHHEDDHNDGHHDEHEDHDDHGDDEEHGDHSNVEFQMRFKCKSAVEQVTITLFSHLKNMQHFEAQWITSKGQGAEELSPSKNSFKP